MLEEQAGGSPSRPESTGSAAINAADHWIRGGMKSVFLQDANSLVIKPDMMIEILLYLRESFPAIERITTYSRSQTAAAISDDKLAAVAAAGLNRIHIGLESGSNKVLELVQKGADKQTHIKGGCKIKKAGIELSEYYIPGLGGQKYSRENALETADALNRINPDFIRIRTMAVSDSIPLAEDYRKGIFTRTNDIEMVQELKLMIENLEGITSYIKSDHTVNLLPEVQGRLPEERDKMIGVIDRFLELPEEDQHIYRIGRRTGIMALLRGLESPEKKEAVRKMMQTASITADNIDEVCDSLMKRFI